MLEDVLHAGAVTPKVPDEAERTAQMRQVIGRAMARSKREIPHYYLSLDIDMRRAVAFLQEANRTRPATERMLPVALRAISRKDSCVMVIFSDLQTSVIRFMMAV